MSLNQPKTNTAAAFESEDEVIAATSTVATPAAKAAAASATQVALKAVGAVAVQSQNVISDLKDAFPLEWDSLPRVLATNGSFFFKDDERNAIGDEIVLSLITYQDQWVVSPNDRKADTDLLKFADNETTAKDGTDLKQHLAELKELGWEKAAITKRLIVAGEMLKANKDDSRVGQLVLIDLPPTGVASFKSYTLQASYAVAKGRKTAEDAKTVTLKAVVDTNKAKETFTKIVFS